MKQIVRRLAQRAGFDVTRHPAPSTLPWLLREALVQLRVDGVVDVGAYQGQFGTMLREVVRYRGPIHSFEPAQASFDRLAAASRKDEGWRTARLALGRTSGMATLNIFQETDFNSLLPPSAAGTQRFPRHMTAAGSEEIEIRRLDEVVELKGKLLLKIDTQGSDLLVVEGATGILDRIVAILLELPAGTPLYNTAPGLVDVVSTMGDLGYELSGLFPVGRPRLRPAEFDGLFVRVPSATSQQALSRDHDT